MRASIKARLRVLERAANPPAHALPALVLREGDDAERLLAEFRAAHGGEPGVIVRVRRCPPAAQNGGISGGIELVESLKS